MTKKNVIFNDPIYGFISTPNKDVRKLIEHPYFQRLRRIKQLGLTHLVYPGAYHTRFQHAMGAMHLMGLAIEVLRGKGVKISDEEASKRRVFDKAFFFLWNFLVPVQVMLVLALFVNLLNGESKRIRYISDASYWVYIIHLPLTHFIPGLFHQSSMNVFLKFTIASVIVTGICFGTYHYLVRSTFIGEILNGRRYSIR